MIAGGSVNWDDHFGTWYRATLYFLAQGFHFSLIYPRETFPCLYQETCTGMFRVIQ